MTKSMVESFIDFEASINILKKFQYTTLCLFGEDLLVVRPIIRKRSVLCNNIKLTKPI